MGVDASMVGELLISRSQTLSWSSIRKSYPKIWREGRVMQMTMQKEEITVRELYGYYEQHLPGNFRVGSSSSLGRTLQCR